MGIVGYFFEINSKSKSPTILTPSKDAGVKSIANIVHRVKNCEAFSFLLSASIASANSFMIASSAKTSDFFKTASISFLTRLVIGSFLMVLSESADNDDIARVKPVEVQYSSKYIFFQIVLVYCFLAASEDGRIQLRIDSYRCF